MDKIKDGWMNKMKDRQMGQMDHPLVEWGYDNDTLWGYNHKKYIWSDAQSHNIFKSNFSSIHPRNVYGFYSTGTALPLKQHLNL